MPSYRFCRNICEGCDFTGEIDVHNTQGLPYDGMLNVINVLFEFHLAPIDPIFKIHDIRLAFHRHINIFIDRGAQYLTEFFLVKCTQIRTAAHKTYAERCAGNDHRAASNCIDCMCCFMPSFKLVLQLIFNACSVFFISAQKFTVSSFWP